MKLLPSLLLLTIISIFVLSLIYLSKKMIYVFGVEHPWLTYTGVILMVVALFFCFGAFMNAREALPHKLHQIAALMIGVYLFLVFSFLVVDGLNLWLKFTVSNYGLLGFALTLVLTLGGYWNAATIRTTSVNIPMPGLQEELKAVHLSDIHIGHFRTKGFLQQMVDKTNAQNPDVVFITGDYLDSKYALDKQYFAPLKQIKAPIYFVDGNHDMATGNDSIVALMRSVGVKVLENEVEHYRGMQIIGLNHMSSDRNSFDVHASGHKPTIEETLPQLKINKEKASVLLHHAPNGIKHANNYGIDLYLAGHTHAGQIFPFNFIANLMFEYNRGLHDFKGTKVYVSEGVGTFGPPFRIGTKSQIIALTLSPS